jgi:hypothetical protein
METAVNPRAIICRLDPDKPTAANAANTSAPAGAHLSYFGGRVISNDAEHRDDAPAVHQRSAFDWLTLYDPSSGAHNNQIIDHGSWLACATGSWDLA